MHKSDIGGGLGGSIFTPKSQFELCDPSVLIILDFVFGAKGEIPRKDEVKVNFSVWYLFLMFVLLIWFFYLRILIFESEIARLCKLLAKFTLIGT